MADVMSPADRRYGAKVDKNSNAYVDPYIDKMTDEETSNYDVLRKKGFKTDESIYHATNPRGRLFPKGTKDPWAPDEEKN